MIRQRWRAAEGFYHSVGDGYSMPTDPGRTEFKTTEKYAVLHPGGVWRVLQMSQWEHAVNPTTGAILFGGQWSEWQDVPVEGE